MRRRHSNRTAHLLTVPRRMAATPGPVATPAALRLPEAEQTTKAEKEEEEGGGQKSDIDRSLVCHRGTKGFRYAIRSGFLTARDLPSICGHDPPTALRHDTMTCELSRIRCSSDTPINLGLNRGSASSCLSCGVWLLINPFLAGCLGNTKHVWCGRDTGATGGDGRQSR